jgi:ADP-ribosyl-[dinitrogen reductase] hydrolase
MLKGSCLCGDIHYEVTQLDSPIVHCSCQSCIKAHAAAFNTGAGVNRNHFKWTKGQESLSSYESSPGKLRHFCGRCGSQLLAEKEGQKNFILRVATLDDDPGVKPEYQIWKSHERPWLENHDKIVSYKEWGD